MEETEKERELEIKSWTLMKQQIERMKSMRKSIEKQLIKSKEKESTNCYKRLTSYKREQMYLQRFGDIQGVKPKIEFAQTIKEPTQRKIP